MSISFQTNVASMIAATNLTNNNTFQTQTITQLDLGLPHQHLRRRRGRFGGRQRSTAATSRN